MEMENLQKMPFSEVGATLERLALFGATPELLKNIRSSDEVAVEVVKALRMDPSYSSEETTSHSIYPKEYSGPKSIESQIKMIALTLGLNPERALTYARNLPKLPEGAEGWFAIPSKDALARKHFPKVIDPREKYCRALLRIFKIIYMSRQFNNDFAERLVPNRLRFCTQTVQALETIAQDQPGDILIIAAQLGLRHRGRSVRKARKLFKPNEFGLPGLAGGSILLTHSGRITGSNEQDLCMSCSGEEFALTPDDTGFDGVLGFTGYVNGGMRAAMHENSSADSLFGSATGFTV